MSLPAKGIVLLLLAAGLLSCGADEAPTPVREPAETGAAPEGTIAAVGDSLTAGMGLPEAEAWPALMGRRLRDESYSWKVVNAGVSGETSSGTRSRIDWIMKVEPDIVVLETGANDGLRGLPVNLLRENLDAILTVLAEQDVIVVLAGMRMVTNLGSDYTGEFAQVYEDLAAKHKVVFIPFMLEGVAGNPRLNQADGIHPTAEGQRVMMETAYPYILEAIQKFRTKNDGVSP